jgi:hypothetical protein
MIVAGDFETYYDKEYSLSKMTTAEYILDHRFQIIMLSLRIDNNPPEIYFGKQQVQARLAQLDWSQVAWLSHHVNFDAAILYWHLGFEPAMFLCTLSMARATTHWVLGKSALAPVSTYLGLPPKGDEVVRAIGKRLENFTRAELVAYANYCTRDNENARAIFDRLRPLFNNSELRLIDQVARMHIMPQVRLNAHVLAEHLAAVEAEKARVLGVVGQFEPAMFSSQQRFAELLEQHGVDVPMKKSPVTGAMIPALAKHDREFKELCEDAEQPIVVQALLAARLQVKSTIEETRTRRMLKLALLRWPDGSQGWMPAPLKYFAARTGRLGGDDKYNVQNLVRGSRIRESIEAPPGYRIVHRDSSQIEARMVAWLAQCLRLLSAFRDPARDVYCEFASSVYGIIVTKLDKLRRFVGKTGILGLGYGCGHIRFRHMLFIGNGGMSIAIEEQEAKHIINVYRYKQYPEVPVLWDAGAEIIIRVAENSGRQTPGYLRTQLPSYIPIQIGYDSVWLPNGMCLSYPELHYQRDPQTFEINAYYKNAFGSWTKMYGPKFIENLSQALTRIIITDAANRIFEETRVHPFLTAHDSLSYCVPESEVEWWDRKLEYEFSVVPRWAPGLPLASEGGWGRNLLAAEQRVND